MQALLGPLTASLEPQCHLTHLTTCPHYCFTDRFATVLKHFPSAMGVDDFIARTEVALCYFGFTGDNTIGK